MKLNDQHEQLKYKFHLSLLYLLCRHTDECADNDPSQRHALILNDFWSEKYYNAFLGKQSLYLQLRKRLSTEHMTQLCMAVAIQLYRKPAFVNGNGYCRAVISVPSYRYKAYPKRLYFFQTPISVAQTTASTTNKRDTTAAVYSITLLPCPPLVNGATPQSTSTGLHSGTGSHRRC